MKFRLIDKITGWETRSRAVGIKAVSFEEYCLKQAFGDSERLPESLELQAVFDLACWLVILSSDFKKTACPISVEKIEFKNFLLPGQRMEVRVEVASFDDDRVVFSGRGLADGHEIIVCDNAKSQFFPLSDFEDPADRRTLFSEIFQEHPEVEVMANR